MNLEAKARAFCCWRDEPRVMQSHEQTHAKMAAFAADAVKEREREIADELQSGVLGINGISRDHYYALVRKALDKYIEKLRGGDE